MRASVLSNFVTFNTPLEGLLSFMYLDQLGYVTTGMGDLIDPVSAALGLSWTNSNGSAASSSDITAAWNAVDAQRTQAKGTLQTGGLAMQGGGVFGSLTTIRLTPAAIQQTVSAQLNSNETYARKYFPNWDDFCADAQMGILSMQWAMGAAFPATFTQFTAAANSGDWTTASAQSVFRGTGVQARINQDKILFGNAQVVADKSLDPDALYWPSNLQSPGVLTNVLLAGAGVVALALIASPLLRTTAENYFAQAMQWGRAAL